jgi:hypothetical protein
VAISPRSAAAKLGAAAFSLVFAYEIEDPGHEDRLNPCLPFCAPIQLVQLENRGNLIDADIIGWAELMMDRLFVAPADITQLTRR